MKTSEELPEELVEEILCHVPARNLKRLRSTCKRWNGLYEDWRFARKHSDKSPKQFMVLMLTNDMVICPRRINFTTQALNSTTIPSIELKDKLNLVDPKDSSAFQFGITRVFHCDGLLLCICLDESMVVWNPFTGETRWIEAGNRYCTCRVFVLGYSSNNRRLFKILSFCLIENDYEIYEFNCDSWRILDHEIAPGWGLVESYQFVSLNGSTYMFAMDETETELGLSLLRFDFSTEKCKPVRLPYQRKLYEATSLSIVGEEKLSVLLQQTRTSKTEIWLSNTIDEGTTKAVSWSKVLALDLSRDLQICNYSSFLLDEEKKLIVCCTRWVDMEHESNAKDKIYVVGEDSKVTQVDFGIIDWNNSWPAILYYVPSLVQIDGAHGKKKRLD